MAEILPFRRQSRRGRVADPRPPYARARNATATATATATWRSAALGLGPILWALPLAAGVAVFVATAPDAIPDRGSRSVISKANSGDRESAQFGRCGGLFSSREACVIDGDTFWYRGEKIRVADINTPELNRPQCSAEADLAARATRRFTELMNAGAFSLEPIDRSHDMYGRALFMVTRGGESLGDVLVREGLAEEWSGARRGWC